MFLKTLIWASRRLSHNINRMSVEASASGASLRCATFNVLAPCYKRLREWWNRWESSQPDLYIPRFKAIAEFIATQEPPLDVVCLQEFWFNDDVSEIFDTRLGESYNIIKLKRQGMKTDGLAILLNKSIKIFAIQDMKFNDINRRVGLLVHALLPQCDQEVVLMTTHLTYCNSFVDQYLRMSQVKKVVTGISEYLTKNGVEDVPVILAGDFNGSEGDPACDYVMQHGFISSYKAVNGREPNVTHRDHIGQEKPVDFIYFRDSGLCQVKPTQSCVLPLEYSDQAWPEDFTLSDHRMVMTEFHFETPQQA